MVNWIAKASGAMSRETEELPQEFQLSCECGQSHQGQRKSKSQRIICQTCGSALFVLPRNVYPTLTPLKPKRRRRRKAAASRRELPSLRSFTGRVGRATAQAGRLAGQAVHSTGLSAGQWLGNRIAGLLGAVRALLTPFRLVLGGITTMLVVTAVVTVHNRGLEQARETLRIEFASGEEALLEDDAVRARTHFQKAALAAERLQSNDARSRQARQMLHETTVMTQLASASLLEILEEAEQITGSERPELWEDRFRATYAGTWILLEATVHLPTDVGESTDAGEESSVVIDFPLVVGEQGRPVSVTARVANTAMWNLTEEPQRAIFAASLTRCELDSAEEQWHVTLNGESGFLWSNVDNLRSLGFLESVWDSEEETLMLLEGQSKILGLR